MLKRIRREPLFHFLVVALLIFAAHDLLRRGADAPDKIVVSVAKIEQMATVFAKTWQRPPNKDELKGMIDDYVKEEILVRQALQLGLDRGDTVVRRRLRQKMEFLSAADSAPLTATDPELEAYLAANPAAFTTSATLAFEQVFLNPSRHGDTIAKDAEALLAELRTNDTADPALLGDTSLLPATVELTNRAAIDQMFGGAVADGLETAPIDKWTGPIASSFGLHLVRVTERTPGQVQQLAGIRDEVTRKWENARRTELERQRFGALLAHYEISIEAPTAAGESR
ncbi:peptidyl-prolyl cis-trans isomerase [Ensifer sp. ENS09]|uniref:peptidylprolyl isomerase n=1 Tax=Ensifer sp. ENS09 TaxID=2769263 RepID=UPI00177E90CB|nr:peptidylprolyl isomerase [Ensifer sp. ENS09]MBD9649915.1 peptidyl-prolyl cis-trans isomerase [Ensifer sp. ENS09]